MYAFFGFLNVKDRCRQMVKNCCTQYCHWLKIPRRLTATPISVVTPGYMDPCNPGGRELPYAMNTARISSLIAYALPCFALPCLGPLAQRGAVGARLDRLPHQFSLLLLVVCHGLSLCEGFASPLRDVVNPDLFRPAPSSTAFDCSL